jgi:MFS family permease
MHKAQTTTKLKFDINLFSICLADFLVPFMGSAINLAMPKIGHSFSMNAVTLTWVATAYLLSTAIFQIPFAKVADMFGRKKLFCIGMLLFAATTIGCGLVQTTELFLLLRFVEGIGSAIIFGTGMAILVSLYPSQMRGRILGINTSVVYVALACGPFFGGMLTDYLGWQSLFILAGIVAILIFIFALIFIKQEWKEADKSKFDVIGSVIYGLSIFALIYGVSNLPRLVGIIFLSIGILFSIIFVVKEGKINFPILNIKLFSKNKVFAMSTLAALINYASTSAIAFLLSLYLQYILGFESRHAGLVLISQSLIMSFCALISGRLSDKIHPSRLATFGMSIIVVGLVGLVFISMTTPVWYIVIALLLFGIGFGMFSSPNTNVIMSSVSKEYLGQASATTGTARLLGQTFSLGIAGMLISIFLGKHKITAEVFPQFLICIKVTFIIFAILCLIGVYASINRIKKV